MKRLIVAVTVATAAVALSGTGAVAAQGKGHGGSKAKKTHTAPHAAKPHAQGDHTKKHAGDHGRDHTSTQKAKAHKGRKKAEKATATTGRLSPVQRQLHDNPNLSSTLRSRLPANSDLVHASEGFRNLGQFVAAVNVSRNLGIPFSQLKRRIVDEELSLGQAIKAERSDVDAPNIARRAEIEADALIAETTRSKSAKRK